jgi:hypothetical protein
MTPVGTTSTYFHVVPSYSGEKFGDDVEVVRTNLGTTRKSSLPDAQIPLSFLRELLE